MHGCIELTGSFHSSSLRSFIPYIFYAMGTTRTLELTHPPGDVAPIVGICADDLGRSCIEHTCCGEQVQLNAVLRVCRVQIHTSQGEETSVCFYIVNDGIDQCRVAFLKRSFTECDKYDGALVRVVNVISLDDCDAVRRAKFHCFHGCAKAAVIGVTEQCPSSCDEQHSHKTIKKFK